jgi:3-phenylpropionate/cinnamic acid dioxygenase small subunit
MHAKRLQGALRMHAMWHQRGSGLQKPETLIIGDLVLIRRDIVATNKIKSVLKLTRIYSSKAYKVTGISGNHVSVQVDGSSHVYHRKRLQKFFNKNHYRFKMSRNAQMLRIVSPNIVFRKLYAYQVNNLICILQSLIDSHASDE